MAAAGRIRPYEHLSDQELWSLAGDAADLRLRLAMCSPGEVRQTLIDHGCPAKAATRQVQDPQGRGYACRFHLDVADAALGDELAALRVEHVEAGWTRMRELRRVE
ncbi:MAG TPA: hypothetical protein VHU24_03120 [Solirubrobacterales bacterium]|jgi:hypothetical protein|nr:hypothetical protein [Solirubrobacterales bacterium]